MILKYTWVSKSNCCVSRRTWKLQNAIFSRTIHTSITGMGVETIAGEAERTNTNTSIHCDPESIKPIPYSTSVTSLIL
ncbi:hypothetical protein KP509_20G082400 [Ceratopteris richardii]|uniref:Uncharacterized protein n=1 Tax=Ceratopteris richardii TaxID=49495 RepID=A0A8T2SIN6_CERRI|nr:hypothetical protein KP509_20G082400 [Ceratopteris richardii]